jgi:hypothetical protein
MSANNVQIGGTHYQNKSIQPWDYIVSNGLGYLEGCVVKYVSRHSEKGGVEDLRKAQHYLEKLIEISTTSQAKEIDEMFEKKDNGIVVLKTRKPKAPYGYKLDGTPKKRPGRPRSI